MTCPTCARHKRDLAEAHELLRRVHRGEPIDDGLGLFRGLLVGLLLALPFWIALAWMVLA